MGSGGIGSLNFKIGGGFPILHSPFPIPHSPFPIPYALHPDPS
jgi:hypothetical protein